MTWSETRPPESWSRVASWRASSVGAVKPGRCAIMTFSFSGDAEHVLADLQRVRRRRMKRQQRAIETGKLMRLCHRLDMGDRGPGRIARWFRTNCCCVIKPMNSTDMGSSRFCLSYVQRPSARRPAVIGGVVLRRMNAAAQNVAIVPFERIGAGQAVIAGQRQRVLDDGDRIVRDRQLEDLASVALSATPSSKSPAKLSSSRALTASRTSMPPTTSCARGSVASGAPRFDGMRVLRKSTSQSRAARATPS